MARALPLDIHSIFIQLHPLQHDLNQSIPPYRLRAVVIPADSLPIVAHFLMQAMDLFLHPPSLDTHSIDVSLDGPVVNSDRRTDNVKHLIRSKLFAFPEIVN